MPQLQKQTHALESELQSLKMAALDEAKYLQLAESLAGFCGKLRVSGRDAGHRRAPADSAPAGEGSSGGKFHDYAASFDPDSAIRVRTRRIIGTASGVTEPMPNPGYLLRSGSSIPTVAKRLGHANANITLAIYAHALEADELAAAKIWDDAMVRSSVRTNGSRIEIRARSIQNWKLLKNWIGAGGDDGARTRDLRRDRPAF